MSDDTSEKPSEITVLGAGIVGICTALALTETGLKVRLVDRDAPGQATSFGNAGIVSPWSVVPQSMPGLWKKIPGWLFDQLGPVAVRPEYFLRLAPWGMRFLAQGRRSRIDRISEAMGYLNRDNITLYRSLLKGTGHEGLLRDSYYVHACRGPSAANPDTLEHDMRRSVGATIERIEAAELHDLEPALSREFRAAILIKGQARVTSPGRLCTVLAEKFVRQGGEIQRATVRAIKPADGGGWTYATDTEQIHARKVVLAMGVWSAELLKPLGIRIPLEAERGYHVSFADPGVSLTHSVLDMDMKFVASSMEDGLRFAGTAEFAGLDAPINQMRADNLAIMARKLLPDMRTDKPTIWSGQRPSLPDSLPCIGEIKGFPGLIAAFGHSHFGLMMAPKTGRIVADIVTDKKPNVDLTPYAPLRF